MGRFISVDIASPDLKNPQTLNKYRYSLNNPTRYVDKTGLYEEDVHYMLTLTFNTFAKFDRITKVELLQTKAFGKSLKTH
jgi:pyocin large subunit-like protein